MNRMKYDFLESIKKMPPLLHTVKGEAFDIMQSEAAKWIAAQPEVMQKIFDTARYRGVIRYDAETGRWQGVDYDGDRIFHGDESADLYASGKAGGSHKGETGVL